MSEAKLYLISGVMAAGKSTVAQALAERFDPAVHVRGDTFRRSIVSGRVEMSAAPSQLALQQLRLRYELAVAVSDRYIVAGYTTVMQDVILGPMLKEVVAMATTAEVHLVVLAPSVEAIEQREAERQKTGYGGFSPAQLDGTLRERTPRMGLWVDSTDMTVAETVDYIVEHSDAAVIRQHQR